MTNPKVEQCPICGEGYLHEIGYDHEFEHNGHSGIVHLKISKCDECLSEVPTDSQTLANKRAVIAFEKSADNRLSGSEIRSIRKALSLTQAEAAKVFGGGKSAFSKYESNDITQSESMDKLIRLCHEVPQAYDWLLRNSGVEMDDSRFEVNDLSLIFATYVNEQFPPTSKFVVNPYIPTTRSSTHKGHIVNLGNSLVTKVTAILKPEKTGAVFSFEEEPMVQSGIARDYKDADYDRFAIQGSLS
ncbi:type II toxin-antitoxin system MqsA family antitoxin [Pseudomonas wayambapalatensis]|nr:type II toxin-antitoxin system MqsA family antitoxin [Pseudomonas wayambapalatensis]